MATLLDVSGAPIALAGVQPDWIATSNLSIHRTRPVNGAELRAESRPLRVGSRSVVVETDLFVDGARCGFGRMTFARIPGSSTVATVDRDLTGETVEVEMAGGTRIEDPVDQLCGMESVGPGQIRFDKTEYVANSFGTVNGGVLALSADVAAVSAAGGGAATDLQIHYLAQIGEGPVAVTAAVERATPESALCAVRIEDRSTRTLVAVADVTVTLDEATDDA